MSRFSVRGLLLTLIVFLIIPQQNVDGKTTLSKIQYINAIRDIIEGLIKSLATRQKIEMNRRLELQEYRKHHEQRLGRDILVCRLCKEIFIDPDKYFDHAHFHVVEKLKLMATTDANVKCRFCDGVYPNQIEYHKHCYEDHLLQNLDKLTTKALETTTTKRHNVDELHCKICNQTFMYSERFYMHSLQHLQDNMDLILNQTKSKTQEDHSDLTTEQIASKDRSSRSKDNIDISFITEHVNLNKVLTTLKKRYSNVFNKNKYSNTYHVCRNSSKWKKGRENDSSGWIQKFPSEPRVRGHLRRNQYTNSNSYNRYNGNYTILRRYYNHTFNNGIFFQKIWNYSNNKFSTFFKNRIKYTTTIYFNQNLYKNFNYDAHGYDNMINVKNKAIKNEAGSYFTSYTSRYSRPYKRTNYRSNTSIKVTHANKNLYKNMNLFQNVNTVNWIKSHPKTGNIIVKPIYVNNRNLYKTTDNVNHSLRSPVDAIIGFHKEENHGSSSKLKRYENNKRDEDPGELTDVEQKNINANASELQNIRERVRRQITTPTTECIGSSKTWDRNKSWRKEPETKLDTNVHLLNTTGWTSLYSTASRIIERFFQTHVRVVRITKDLRTTKKVTLKLYTGTGAEEFTGDSFQGSSGEDRYERVLMKMRDNKVYLKCPYCPLRFYYHPEMMGHISTSHNLTGNFNETTFEVPFRTKAPDQTKYTYNGSFEEFCEQFPTFDYEFLTTTQATAATERPTESTTFDIKAFSAMMQQIMKPEFVKGMFTPRTTPGSTRNIDFLYRARTFLTAATTMPQLHQMHGALKNARDFLRKLASTMMDDSEYAEIATTTEITRAVKKIKETTIPVGLKIEEVHESNRDVEKTKETLSGGVKIEEITDINTKGVKIEEVTTPATTSDTEDATTLSKKEMLQMGMNILEEHYQMIQKNVSISPRTWEPMSTTHNSSIRTRTTRHVERFRIFKPDVTDRSQILREILRKLNGTQAENEIPSCTTNDRIVTHKRSVLGLTAVSTQMKQTRLGPTAMSYEDSGRSKPTERTSFAKEENLRAEDHAKCMASLKSLSTSDVLTTTPSEYQQFLRKLAALKAEEKRRKEKAKADYDARVSIGEANVDHWNTPLFMNVNDMDKYEGEDEARNKKVKEAYKFIVDNKMREAMWNTTGHDGTTYDDGYGDLDYETRTQYVYDPTDLGVFQNERPTWTTKFVMSTMTPPDGRALF